jgi:hypothetical protein
MLQAKWGRMLDWNNEYFNERLDRLNGRSCNIDGEIRSIMISIFVMDLWSSEGDYFVNDPYELMEYISTDNMDEAMEILINVDGINSRVYARRQYIKSRNLYLVATRVFNEQHRRVVITQNMIKKLHAEIVIDLDISSDYRVRGAKPIGYDVHYTPPHRIASRMDELCRFVDSIKPENARETILLASLFLTEFLLIHPFANGNGRTARVIFSMMLFQYTIVPVSLSAKRELYLTTLYELDGGNNLPVEFAKFAINQCDMTSRMAQIMSM